MVLIQVKFLKKNKKREAAKDGSPPIELIDGKKLVELFEKVELGVKPKIVYEVDYNFFETYMKK